MSLFAAFIRINAGLNRLVSDVAEHIKASSRNAHISAAADKVANLHLPDEGHDYGASKRRGVYALFERNLGLSFAATRSADGSVEESPIVIEKQETLCVFTPQHPRPNHAPLGAEAAERLLESQG